MKLNSNKKINKIAICIALFYILNLCACTRPKRKLVIYHTNDLNGSITNELINSKKRAGIPSTVSCIKKLTSSINSDTGLLIFDSGDAIFGSTIANLSKGKAPVRMLNNMKLKSLTPGNKEFNYKPDVLNGCSKSSNFPFLCANVINKKTDRAFPFFKKYEIFYTGGLKICAIGLVPESMKFNINAETSNDYKFLNPSKILSKICDDLKKEKIDLKIVIAHMNIDQIKNMLSATSASSDINVIISAENFYEDSQIIPEGIEHFNDALITWGTVAHNRRGIGCLELSINKSGRISSSNWHLEIVNPDIYTPDEACLDISKSFESRTTHWDKKILGFSKKDFIHSHSRETPFGSMIIEVLCKKGDSQIGLINASAIKKGLSAGKITKKDIFEMMPYTNKIISMDLKGIDIIKAIEHSLNRKSKSILLVSGLKYRYKQNLKGQRILVECLFKNKPVDKNRIYRISTSGFLANGGNHFTMFKNGKKVKTHGTIKEALIKWVTKQKNPINLADKWKKSVLME